jgi:hypothetical protein
MYEFLYKTFKDRKKNYLNTTEQEYKDTTAISQQIHTHVAQSMQ